MKYLLLFLLFTPALADEPNRHLSTRLREAFREMLRDDWKPQKEVELSDSERRELLLLFAELKKQPPPQLLPKTEEKPKAP